MTRPRLLDLFCGAGGAAMGYHRAGFEVIGVDIEPQPRYPFEFHQADAMSILRGMADYPTFSGEMWRPGYFAAIHASPPCQDHSALSTRAGADGTGWMLAATRDLLRGQRLPWVIENVPGAPMAAHFILCGSMFGLTYDRWQLRRHRLFETSGFFALVPSCIHDRPALGVYGNSGGRREGGRKGTKAHTVQAGAVMGIDWMTRAEMTQAIPPAYTEFIGRALIEHLASGRAA